MPVAYYIENGLLTEDKHRAIIATVHALRHEVFDAIAFRGLSGALVAPAVAWRLRKALVAVRKGETTHSSNPVECGVRGKDDFVYWVVDDHVSTGSTVKAIIAEITAVYPLARCAGVALWNRCADQDDFYNTGGFGLPPVRCCIGFKAVRQKANSVG